MWPLYPLLAMGAGNVDIVARRDLNLGGNVNPTHILPANTSGNLNTAVGPGAMQFNTTGSTNSALGSAALRANTAASLGPIWKQMRLRALASTASCTGPGSCPRC